jgi:hypothetical protein
MPVIDINTIGVITVRSLEQVGIVIALSAYFVAMCLRKCRTAAGKAHKEEEYLAVHQVFRMK